MNLALNQTLICCVSRAEHVFQLLPRGGCLLRSGKTLTPLNAIKLFLSCKGSVWSIAWP